MVAALDLLIELATTPGFDSIHDPDPSTPTVEPYHDDAGYPTIGFGHLLSRKRWAPLAQWQPISVDQAHALLRQDARKALASVARLCPVPLTPQQSAALGDFVYNCGGGNLEISTLRKCVLRGEHARAIEEFPKWVYAGGVKMRGLVRRRRAEADLYASG